MTVKESNDEINNKIIEMLKTRKLSYSSLKALNKSPMHFVEYLTGKFEQTPAMVLGSVFDCLVLTPEDFDKTYVVSPVFNGTGMRARKAAFIEENQDRQIITEAQYATAQAMKFSLERNGIGCRTANYKGEVQKKLVWKDRETKRKFVGYIDKDCDDFIYDLKSCNDASPDKFTRDAYNLDYPLQAAMYLSAVKKLWKVPFCYVCVENKEPFGVSVFQCSNDYISYGLEMYNKLCLHVDHCIKNRKFHMSYDYYSSTEYHMLELPGYAKFKN